MTTQETETQILTRTDEQELGRLRERIASDEEATAQEFFTTEVPIPASSGFLPADFSALHLNAFQLATLRKIDFPRRSTGLPIDTRAVPPASARVFFEDLTEEDRQQLVLSLPELVAGWDGAPHKLRYQANRILIEEAVADLEGEVSKFEGRIERLQSRPGASPMLIEKNQFLLNERKTRRRMLQGWVDDPNRQFLLLDVQGDGRVIEVLGDLEDAEHVLVFVPGVGNELTNYERENFSMRARLNNLFDRTRQLAPDAKIAAVGWLGFNPPDSFVSGVGSSPARFGAAALVRFIEGLFVDTGRDLNLTAVGHSYGSVVCGRALAFDLDRWADNLVVAGSPGVGVASVDEIVSFGLPFDRFYAMMADDDPIRHTPFGIHGPLPVSKDFGAQRLDSLDASGHSNYFDFDKQSLKQICSVVLGLLDDLQLIETGD